MLPKKLLEGWGAKINNRVSEYNDLTSERGTIIDVSLVDEYKNNIPCDDTLECDECYQVCVIDRTTGFCEEVEYYITMNELDMWLSGYAFALIPICSEEIRAFRSCVNLVAGRG